MTQAATLGFPHAGAGRELKTATEACWRGEIDGDALEAVGRELRARHWRLQQAAGIDVIPSNDFSFHDPLLDMSAALGAVPPQFSAVEGEIGLDVRFAMARGVAGAPAMATTRWFDTDVHYIAPELHADQRFRLASRKAVREYEEARALGVETRPVLIGPITWLLLGKARTPGLDPLSLLPAVLPVYEALLAELKAAGADWVQIDEPILLHDLSLDAEKALERACARLAAAGPKVMLATYSGGLRRNLPLAMGLPVAGLHVDLVRGPEQIAPLVAMADIGAPKVLSLGVIDGRNGGRADLDAALAPVKRVIAAIGRDRVQIAPSCALRYAPVDREREESMDDGLTSRLAVARQKLEELAVLARVSEARGADAARDPAMVESREAARRRATAETDADPRRQRPCAESPRAPAATVERPGVTVGALQKAAEVRQELRRE